MRFPEYNGEDAPSIDYSIRMSRLVYTYIEKEYSVQVLNIHDSLLFRY